MAYIKRELELYTKLFGLKEPFDVEEGLKDGSFVCAPAAAGSKYEQSPLRLMYVGRALNGWPTLNGNNPAELAESALTYSRKEAEDFLYCTVHDYQSRNENGIIDYTIIGSPFWQLCRAIMSQSGEGDAWAESIVWSNVYKVNPKKDSADKLPYFWDYDKFKPHFDVCIDILREEIELFRPTHVVFVTGASFFRPDDFGDAFEPAAPSLVEDPDRSTFAVVSKGIYTDSSGNKIKIVATTRTEI